MAPIPAGVYRPLFAGKQELKEIPVGPFLIDRFAVSNSSFLEFVKEVPRWRRDSVKSLFADESYLRHWTTADSFKSADADAPVTNVSWFAAKAYCRWRKSRLPTVAEWEFVALASETAADGRLEPSFVAKILELYSRPLPSQLPSVREGMRNFYGVHELHGIIWEWTSDFNTMMVTGESRGDSALERELFCGGGAVGVSEQARVNYPAFLRAGFRSSLQGPFAIHNLGFRCARDNSGEPQ